MPLLLTSEGESNEQFWTEIKEQKKLIKTGILIVYFITTKSKLGLDKAQFLEDCIQFQADLKLPW